MTVSEGGSSVGMTSSLRQSSRAKKPSRRAEEMHLAASAASAVHDTEAEATTSGKKGSTAVQKKMKRGKSSTGQTSSRPRSSSEAEKEGDDDGGEYEQEEEDDDSEVDIDDGGEDREDEGEDGVGADESESSKEGDGDENGASDEIFCLCRKGDDGKPMVFCAECNDWFHFKCIGLNKKTAETLSEYICPPCSEKTGKVSKTTTTGNSKRTENEEEDGPPSSAHDDSDTYSPPRRPSTLLKRKSTEQENVRKRSRGESPIPPESQKRASVANSPNRPSESTRKASVSEAAPTGSIAAIKTRSETLRKHAVDQLSTTFEGIFDEHEGDERENSSDRAGKYAVEFERALFEQYSESIPKTMIKTAGKAYRDRLRSFLFNLKDKSNVSLRKKIAMSELGAAELAAMSNDELANDEIRKEVERRKRENLEQSILKKEKAPLRKLTHKGEIDIEYEAAQSSRVADEQGEMERAAAAERKIPTLGAGPGNVTANEGRNTGMMSPPSTPALPSKQAPSMSPVPARRISNSLQSPTTSFDFANVWTAGGASEEKPDDEEESLDGDDMEGEVPEEKDQVGARDTGDDGADTFIDDFLGMPEGSNQAEEEPGTTREVPASGQEEIRWRGTISMPEEGMCTGKMQQVAGRQLESEEWTKLFPTAHSVIEGRLPSASAAPYLEQSRLTSRTELVVMAFKPSWEPESLKQAPAGGPRDASENSLAYKKLVSYFERRDRYGVLPPHPTARGSLVKDFYILPLPKEGPAPKWLDLCMREDALNGMELDRDDTYFVIVAVLFRQTSRQDQHFAYSPPQASTHVHATAQSNAATPPYAGLNTLLGGAGSNTLQDLLRAVGGGNRSPATQVAAVAAVQPGGYESPPESSAIMQTTAQHPTFESLSEMPKPQLEDMLQKNPNLVDQLLKTLGTTGTSKAASPRPPGPPPPPPPGLQRVTSDPARPPPMPSHQSPPYGQPYNAGYPQQHYPPHAQQGYNYGNTAQFRPTHPQAAPPPPGIEQGWHQNSGYYPRPPSGYAAAPPTNYGPPIRGGRPRGGGHAAPRRY